MFYRSLKDKNYFKRVTEKEKKDTMSKRKEDFTKSRNKWGRRCLMGSNASKCKVIMITVQHL